MSLQSPKKKGDGFGLFREDSEGGKGDELALLRGGDASEGICIDRYFDSQGRRKKGRGGFLGGILSTSSIRVGNGASGQEGKEALNRATNTLCSSR